MRLRPSNRATWVKSLRTCTHMRYRPSGRPSRSLPRRRAMSPASESSRAASESLVRRLLERPRERPSDLPSDRPSDLPSPCRSSLRLRVRPRPPRRRRRLPVLPLRLGSRLPLRAESPSGAFSVGASGLPSSRGFPNARPGGGGITARPSCGGSGNSMGERSPSGNSFVMSKPFLWRQIRAVAPNSPCRGAVRIFPCARTLVRMYKSVAG